MSFGHHADERDCPGFPDQPRMFFDEPRLRVPEDLGPADPDDDDGPELVADSSADWSLGFEADDRDWPHAASPEAFALAMEAAGKALLEARSHHLLRAEDCPEAFAGVLLIGQDPEDLDGAAEWAARVLEEHGPLPPVCWITRFRGGFALLNRDPWAGDLRFEGHDPIPFDALVAAGFSIPKGVGP